MRLTQLIAKLQSQYDLDQIDSEVRVQDQDGIYKSEVVGVEEANGTWIIVKTQPKESA